MTDSELIARLRACRTVAAEVAAEKLERECEIRRYLPDTSKLEDDYWYRDARKRAEETLAKEEGNVA